MRGFLSVRQTVGCSATCLFAAEDSGKEILCPNATCKGTLELALNGAAPELFGDMHGDAAEGISSSNGKITLKSIMLCKQNGKSVHFAPSMSAMPHFPIKEPAI